MPRMRRPLPGVPSAVMHGRHRVRLHRAVAAIFAATLLLSMLAGIRRPPVAAAGPPFPDRPAGTPHRGRRRGLQPTTRGGGRGRAARLPREPRRRHRGPTPRSRARRATRRPRTPMPRRCSEQWDVGGGDGLGAVMLWDFDRQTSRALVSVALSDGLAAVVDAEAHRDPGRDVDERTRSAPMTGSTRSIGACSRSPLRSLARRSPPSRP